jgi:hypothetical protein
MTRAAALKAIFAKRALRFANGARWQRAAALALAAALFAALVGAFGTGGLPLGSRLAFWLGLVGWNWLKWELLFAVLLRRGLDWRAILAIGCCMCAISIPFEVRLALDLAGSDQTASHGGLLLRSAALTVLLAFGALVLVPWLHRASASQVLSNARPDQQVPPRFEGTAIRLDSIAALVAEDHYIRLHLADGSERLVLHRFGDALAQLAGTPGEQVHRSAWIADQYRGEAIRSGKRWSIRAGPVTIPVSRSHSPRLRKLGWLGARS